ncbi:MAG: redoxin domain-containing protein [Calditrichia bacterium]
MALFSQETSHPEKAMCSVCVLKGESEAEKVKAHSNHNGTMYYFCSKNCKKEFDAAPEAYLPPKLPRPAPDFAIETLDGATVSLKDFKNKLVLLDFWATWCKPCLEIMPELQQLQDTYSDKGFSVAGISIDEDKDSIKKIKKFIKKLKVSYPIFYDAKQKPAWNMFNVKAIPALFLINGNGQVVAQWTGKVDHKIIEAKVVEQLAVSEATGSN